MKMIHKEGAMEVHVSWEPEYTSPNEFWGIWERCESDHPDGIRYRGGHRGNHGYWRNTQQPLADLVHHFLEQGRDRSIVEAIQSLTDDLTHYLDGHSLQCTVAVKCLGVTLYEEYITTDYSHVYFDSEEEAAVECVDFNFVMSDLIQKGKDKLFRLQTHYDSAPVS